MKRVKLVHMALKIFFDTSVLFMEESIYGNTYVCMACLISMQ